MQCLHPAFGTTVSAPLLDRGVVSICHFKHIWRARKESALSYFAPQPAPWKVKHDRKNERPPDK